ncbi:MAG: hypothetical protein MZV65_16930 [Chromatiales bacterium]|nr:hypothetical protein [Chromatiales bacterium]
MAGDLVVEPAELFPLVQLNPGDVFSRKRVTETVEKVGERLGDIGYAFANVNTIPEVDEKTKEVVVTFFVDPGQARLCAPHQYDRQHGHPRRSAASRDAPDGRRLVLDLGRRASRRRAWIAWAFSKRSTSRRRPCRAPPIKWMSIHSVTERPSGNLMVGVGYAQSSGILFNASVTQDNFMGSGKRVSASVQQQPT